MIVVASLFGFCCTCSYVLLVLGNSLTNDTIVYDIRSPGHRIVPHRPSNICAEQGGALSNPGIVTVTVI